MDTPEKKLLKYSAFATIMVVGCSLIVTWLFSQLNPFNNDLTWPANCELAKLEGNHMVCTKALNTNNQ